MANYQTLKNSVGQVIKTNGKQEITGQVLQNTLLSIISSVGENYQFVGIATTETNPGTPDQNVFYIAGQGTYTNFSNISVGMGELAVLMWNGLWRKQAINSYIINIYDILSLNKVNKDNLIKGIVINADGKELVSENAFSSPYMRIGKRKSINTNIYTRGGICAFDKDFKSLGYVSLSSTNGKTTLKENVKYIRFFVSADFNMFLYQLLDISEYVEYGVTEEDYEQNKNISSNIKNTNNNTKDIAVLKNAVATVIPSSTQGTTESVLKNGNFADVNNFIQGSVNIQKIVFEDVFFKNNYIEKIINPTTDYNTSSDFQAEFFSETSEFGKLIKSNLDKYTRLECYVFCKEKKFDSVNLRFYSNTTPQGDTKLPYEDTESPYVKKFIVIYDNSVLNSKPSAFLFCSCTIKGLTSNTEKTDFGFTGFKAALFDSLEEAKKNSVKADWIKPGGSGGTVTPEEVIKIIDDIDLGEFGTKFNKVALSQKKLGLSLRLLKGALPKLNNQFERVLVSMNGDSIIGAQLDDLTHSDGYDTGDFPPNMSKITMARKFWEKYRFADEDVIFRNLIHSDWTKQGFNISNGKDDKSQTFNEIEVYGCGSGDYAEINVTGKKYIKFVWSEYKGKPYSFDIMQTIDDGAESKLETITVTADRKLMIAYKIRKLDEKKRYKFKILPKSGFADVCFWGIEAWSKPRLDVVVEAFSGSTSKVNRLYLLDGYYSDFHRPALIISDTLIINDTAFLNGADYSVEQWKNDQAFIYEHIRKNGVPALFIVPHHPTKSYITKSIYDMAELHNLNIVDIPLKQKIEPPKQSIVNNTDGLHISNYGQIYYFEELERIIDNYTEIE